MSSHNKEGGNEHENRVLGGFKAVLHNPNISAETKEHAAEVLASHGIEVEHEGLPPAHSKDKHEHEHTHPDHTKHQHHQQHTHNTRSETHEAEMHHENRVLGGYKATLSNPNVSDEAKEHAREVLKEHDEEV
ncbi:Conidiation protein 6-domain-containing protein [Naematelia encephala]|uniref:Conidiation protein 6-domain-containing protein n=1 Tax=Naematelia encephala TaxID=71784 RepID=A0A1Y2B9C7_9TREE|nr:Conidiation protein 6-domain-containing protein [Naematelia encephala]